MQRRLGGDTGDSTRLRSRRRCKSSCGTLPTKLLSEQRDVAKFVNVQSIGSPQDEAPARAQQQPQHVLAWGRRGRGRAAARAEGARGASGQRSGSAHASSMPPPVAQCFAALQACTHCTHSLSHCTDASTRLFVFRECRVCVRAPRGSPRDCRRRPPRPPAPPFSPELLIRGCRFIFIAGRNRHPASRTPHSAHCILHGTPQCNLFASALALGCSDSFHATCVVWYLPVLCSRVQGSIIYSSQLINSNFLIIK